jgi:EmrB/QacA subfamily drug resistance transporter
MAQAAQAAEGPAHPGLVLATCILASSLAFIDGSVVNVGLPAIGRGLQAGGRELSWVVNGYLLPLSALLLAGGAAGDLYGRRKLLIGGTAVFAAASLACAAAPSFGWFLAGRFLQGVGAAALMPNSLAILGASFGGERRGRAIGTWAAAGAAGGALGPLVGGWLIDAVGWRSIFFINLPIAGAAILLAARYVPPQSAEERPPLDLAGAALAVAGLASLTWGLTVRFSADAAMMLGAGVGLLLAFFLVEKRKGDRAMMPVSLFASRPFVGLTVLTFLLYGAMGGIFVLLPYVLIELSGFSATAAGAALLPLPAFLALTSPTMGRIAGKAGPRLQLTLGPLVVAAGFLLAMRVPGGSFWTATLPAMIVISVGMSAAVAPLTTAVLSAVEARHAGIASGFNSAVARSGGLAATALLGAVLAAKGPALASLYELACVACAAASVGAGASAFYWLRGASAPRKAA